MRDLATGIWWLLLYPLAAGLAAVVGVLLYYVVGFFAGLEGVSALPYMRMLPIVLPAFAAASTFVRASGRFAPAAHVAAATVAVGLVGLGALVCWGLLRGATGLALAIPLLLGALVGLAHAAGRDRRRARVAVARGGSAS